MTRQELFDYIDGRKLAVVASVSPSGAPQSAVVGIAVGPGLELIFDTLDSTRKYRNLLSDPRISLVIGWDDDTTLQVEGTAVLLAGAELQRCKPIYFRKWPDGPTREQWPGIAYFKVTPHWARFSDYKPGSRGIVEVKL